MRLLSKSEINKRKALDRESEIREGMKLAKRVDALRETQADEEASLEKFRRETLAKINGEIMAKTSERDALAKEVAELERQKERTLKPIRIEQSKLEEERIRNAEEGQDLDRREAAVLEKEGESAHALVLAKEELARAEEERRRSGLLLADSAQRSKQAAENLEEASRIKAEALEYKKITEDDWAERKTALDLAEERQKAREERQDRRESELNAREIRLSDREKTLIRNIQRNGRRSER